jgi:hypothetical protein
MAGEERRRRASDWDVYLVKTKADGSKEWEKTFGGSADDRGYSVQCIASGYIIAGSTFS